MKIAWLSGNYSISFNKPYTWMCLGVRGCLPLDEKIITIEGIKTIEEFVKKGGGLVLSDENGILKYNVGIPIFRGWQIVYKIETDAGIIRATAEHPFFTDNGWKKVKELKRNDKVYTLKSTPIINEVNDLFEIKNRNAQKMQILRKRDLCFSSPYQSHSLLFKRLLLEISKGIFQTIGGMEKEYFTGIKAIFSESSSTKNYSRNTVQTVWKDNLCLSKINGKASILLSELPNEMAKSTRQSYETSRNQGENEKKSKGSVCKDVERRDKKEISPANGECREKQICIGRMVEENEGIRTFQKEENILSKTSRETSQCSVKKKQDDFIRESRGNYIEGIRNKSNLESSDSYRRGVEVSRLSNTQHKNFNRMQRNLLAQIRGGYGKKKVIRKIWLRRNFTIRGYDNEGTKSHYKRTTILSILPEGFEPVFDLFVKNAHNFFLANGILTHNSGKSALLEHLAEQYLAEGHTVLDLFGARSAEGLAWLRSDYVRSQNILVLTAENCIATVPSVDTKPYTKLELSDFERYSIIINSCIFYPNIDAEFEAVNNIIDLLWRRRRWKHLIYVLVREAANLLYARMKIAENQVLAKSFMSYWLRESRHSGCSLGLDSQRFMAVDIDIRSLIDFTFLKALGAAGLPRDMWFIYRYIQPGWLQYAKPNQFVIVTRRGDVGVGVFSLVPWHAKEGEDIPSKLGIHVAFEEAPEKGINKGRFKTVGDTEHSIIIAAYIEEPYGMGKLGRQLNRSPATINNVVNEHNDNVEKLGYCPSCRRAKGVYAEKLAKKIRVNIPLANDKNIPSSE